MSATTSAELNIYNHVQDKPVSPLIAELLRERGGNWQGTAMELCNELNLKLAPRSLSVKLDQSVSELERHGVAVTHKKIKGRKVIVFTATWNHTAIATKPHTPTQSIEEEGAANIDDCEGVISFPFSWAYGSIKELSEEEKEEVNRLRHARTYNNKVVAYHKPCAICGGNGGHIDFKKVSDGSSCLICKNCAEMYCASALRLEEGLKKNRGEINDVGDEGGLL